MNQEELLKLILEDEFGLLKVKQKTTKNINANERLHLNFQEINDFFREHGHSPQPNSQDMSEFKLYERLATINSNPDHIQQLKEYDDFKLLENAHSINSIEDIILADDFGLLKEDPESIFQLRHVPKELTTPDYIAQRVPCLDFDKFELLFCQCQADLASGKRKLLSFAMEQQISTGDFYVLRGVLTYVAKIGENENISGRPNPRLRCIFENGTESDMLLRSLARALYKDGRRITEHADRLLDGLSNNKTTDDKETGYIYVLKSLSSNPEIKSLINLYKIGFSRIRVEERIKNAKNDPTYLLAPVQRIAVYECYNLNPQKFELLLHTFFGQVCLNLDVHDSNGHRYVPREWFTAPFEVIEQAISLLLTKEIVKYKYDPLLQMIVKK